MRVEVSRITKLQMCEARHVSVIEVALRLMVRQAMHARDLARRIYWRHEHETGDLVVEADFPLVLPIRGALG